jgi:hypothetical protein
MKTKMRSLIKILVCLCIIVLESSAGESSMLISPDIPPKNSTADERLISREELDERCPQLRKEAILIAEKHPTFVMSSERASYSQKYGYILRYSRRSSVEMPDGTVEDGNSTVILFTKDCSLVHVAMLFPGPGTEW